MPRITMEKKLKIGWFSFTGCEGCTIVLTELFNARYQEWFSKIEFVHARVLRRDDTNEIKEMDIAFVEGAISSDSQEEKLKKIREKAKILIAVGSCAALGWPSNQRNFFSNRQLEEIEPILAKFRYKKKVLKLSDLVKVDEVVPGCPMDERVFLQVLNKYLYASR